MNLEVLRNNLKNQLKATDEDLAEWQSKSYDTDPQIVEDFWSLIDSAPAIAVIGDYDVDGICASYIMAKSILSQYPQKKTIVRIPRRFSEGYGINPTISEELKNRLPKDSLIVTVDNGIAAAEVLEDLEASGYKVALTDHHELGERTLPKVSFLVDPAINDGPFAGQHWCGAGVAYSLVKNVIKKDLADSLLCFAGLATVADCMELREGNWGLVKNTLRQFRSGLAPQSLCILLKALKQDPLFVSEETFGYYLGPAFNAPGRLEDAGATKVLKYLFKPTEEAAEEITALNEERKTLRDNEYEAIREEIATQGIAQSCPIWVYVPNLHEGIVGILAGRVAEDYGVPAIVMTDSSTPGIYKGSARSVGDFDIFKYLNSCGDVFEKMGGHPGAAGLSMTAENFEIAKKNQVSLTYSYITDGNRVDFICAEEIPNINTLLESFRPFGEGNPAPTFAIDIDMSSDPIKMIGDSQNHLVIESTAHANGQSYKIVHFYHEPNALNDKRRFELIGQIKPTAYRGVETPTFQAEDAVDIHDGRARECRTK